MLWRWLPLLAIVVSLWQLRATTDGLHIEQITIGDTPARVYRAEGAAVGPMVVIAHGFAGSQQLMQSFATTFARAGYVAVTFDFRGHGRNPRPLGGSITELEGATRVLVTQMREVVAAVRGMGDGRLAVLGHSMASDIVIRVAQSEPDVAATIAVSMFSPAATADTPRNLLVIDGDWEGMLKREALRVVGLSTTKPVLPGTTYGDFAAGNARRAAFTPNAEHISVLYRAATMAESLAWLDAAFGIERAKPAYLDSRGPWILLLLAGIVALARPLAGLLPIVAARPAGAGLGWRRLAPGLLLPCIATPLLLRVLPTHFLPVLVADYLAVHFATQGLLTAAYLLCMRRPPRAGTSIAWLAAAALAATLYGVGVLFWAIDAYGTSLALGPGRVVLLAIMAIGTGAFFLAIEWLTRGEGAGRGGFVAAQVSLLASMAIAVTLDFERLFFLMIILPLVVVLFVIYGLISHWTYRRTRHPLVGGIVAAVAFAWAIAMTFPLLTG
jgi:dienelactone hydrolase